MNKFSVLNGAKYFSSRIFQNYLVFIFIFIKSGSNFAPTFVDHHLVPDKSFS